MIQVNVSANVLWALGGLYAILLVASAVVAWLRWRAPEGGRTELVQRVRSWWIIVTLFSAALAMSRNLSIVFFAFVSFLALKEYLSIIPTRRADRRVLLWAYLSIPMQYYWVAQGWYGMFIIFIPVYVFLFLPLRMVLMSLFPLRLLPRLHPVAAMDYFLSSRLFSWFALNVVGILPIKRTVARGDDNPLAPCHRALADGQMLIVFPEGSRGEPEHLQGFKGGIARLAESNPTVPVIPVFLHGLGKVLPKGEVLLVPFFCDVFVGEPLAWTGDRRSYMRHLDERMNGLAAEGNFPTWE